MSILALLTFISLLLLSGLAVDVMRYEHRRVVSQASLDAAVLAAAARTDPADVTAIANDFLTKTGLDVSDAAMTANGTNATGGRSVSASMAIESSSLFAHMVGIDTLGGTIATTAEEGNTQLEVALVLDISSSMNEDGRLDALKTAAKDFVTTLLTRNSPHRVRISIIPYNQQVHMPDGMGDALEANGMMADFDRGFSGPHRPGELASVPFINRHSRCLDMTGDDWWNPPLVANTSGSHYGSVFVDDIYLHEKNGVTNTPFEPPEDFSYWCNESTPRVLLYRNDIAGLHNYIDGLTAHGGTSIHFGMKWAVGLLDPEIRPVLATMRGAGQLTPGANGRPNDYGDDTEKVIVLMSDGENDVYKTMKYNVRIDRSPVWYSPSRAAAMGEHHGWMVEFPDNPAAERWYVPGSPHTQTDDMFLTEGATPGDKRQLDYHDLYHRFAVLDAAEFFFMHSGRNDRYIDHINVMWTHDDNWMNTLLDRACRLGKFNAGMAVFTIAFSATEDGQRVLENCASAREFHYDVSNAELRSAFDSIAARISLLKVTQ